MTMKRSVYTLALFVWTSDISICISISIKCEIHVYHTATKKHFPLLPYSGTTLRPWNISQISMCAGICELWHKTWTFTFSLLIAHFVTCPFTFVGTQTSNYWKACAIHKYYNKLNMMWMTGIIYFHISSSSPVL